MALVDSANKHVLLRVVLVGPAGAGKVTNLSQYALPHIRAAQAIGASAPNRPEESPSWLREHGLELNMGQVRDFTVTLRLSAAPADPGGAARRLALFGMAADPVDQVDGLVFVVDSRASELKRTQEVFSRIREELKQCGFDPRQLPSVMQFNKRDAEDAVPLKLLSSTLNPSRMQEFPAVAAKRDGVDDTIKGIYRKVVAGVAARIGRSSHR